jgi:hypothetical protein
MEGNFFILLAVAAVLALAGCLWVLIQIVRKLDPIYDKIAGTAVLRV